MEENKVAISSWKYAELIKKEAKLEALERFVRKTNCYVSVGDIKAILGIEETEGSKNETV